MTSFLNLILTIIIIAVILQSTKYKFYSYIINSSALCGILCGISKIE